MWEYILASGEKTSDEPYKFDNRKDEDKIRNPIDYIFTSRYKS